VIRLLDETTVGHIAAGEVVERPLSVVKELVENALDAGATRVSVAVMGGGLTSIEVADDGSGIARDELRIAFARHATSKLARSSDLESIATLGFRGEGLAAIAAVARVRLISRTRHSEIGYAVDAHGLSVSEPQPIAAPPGTRVVVSELFGNVPARREFVSSPTAEFTRISSFLATLALAYPEVAFSLSHDGRATFAFARAATLAERLAHVFGPAPGKALLPIVPEDAPPSRGGDIVVGGYVSTPGIDRADRRMQLLFVNGRLLRTTQLAGAWSAAYATFALSHRQPFGVIFLDLAPGGVDPNVHPTKSDVRFRRPGDIHDAVRRAISATLARNATARMRDALSLAPPAFADRNGYSDSQPSPDGAYRPQTFALGYATSHETQTAQAPEIDDARLLEVATPELRVLAQLDDTFILATDGRALVLVDQHAAHERVAFEAICARARAGAPVAEPLLVPFVVELEADEAERFERSRDALASAGLDAEPFGERAYRIVATPAGYGARRFDFAAYVDDLGDEIAGLDAPERVWASLACHSVVRAGESLERGEMEALLARLVLCENPMHCPHGRPTIVRLEPDAVARMFKRS
jgi:DNA mismatch repair protein MutL